MPRLNAITRRLRGHWTWNAAKGVERERAAEKMEVLEKNLAEIARGEVPFSWRHGRMRGNRNRRFARQSREHQRLREDSIPRERMPSRRRMSLKIALRVQASAATAELRKELNERLESAEKLRRQFGGRIGRCEEGDIRSRSNRRSRGSTKTFGS